MIATKFGFNVDETGNVSPATNVQDVISHVRAECEASLHRLGTDYVDLYQLHVWDYPLGPAVELREVLEELVGEGKIRSDGWSTDAAEAARVVRQGKHCVAIQHDLNVMMERRRSWLCVSSRISPA